MSYIIVILIILTAYLYFKNKKSQPTSFEEYCKLKGDSYEYQIANYYKERGFKVFNRSQKLGKADMGIDLVAHTDHSILLIQCKNHKFPIQQDLIRKFIGDCFVWEKIEKDKNCKKQVKYIFVSNTKDKYKNKKYLKHISKANFFEFKVIKSNYYYNNK